jgi:hypothetical protein
MGRPAGITVSGLVTRIIGLRPQRERWCNPAVRIISGTVAGPGPRGSMLTLSGAPGSAGKTLHASPGSHCEVPDVGIGSSVRFSARHRGSQGAAL